MDGNGVAHALTRIANNYVAIGCLGVARLRVIGCGGGRGLADTKNVGPLLEHFCVVGVVESGVPNQALVSHTNEWE